MISKYLGDKPFWKSVMVLALPMALQVLLGTSFTLVDTIMVSQLGDISLSAVGMSGQWTWLMNLVLVGITSGMSVFISQYWGIGDVKSIKRVLGIALMLVVPLTLVFLTIGVASPALVMKIFTEEDAVIAEGVKYLRIASFSYFSIGLMQTLATLLRSVENVKVPMYCSFASTVINCLANYVLIFGKFGFPQMGIKGAALATALSSWIGLFTLILISIKQKNIIIGRLSEFFRFTLVELKSFIKTATPVVINESVWGLGTFVFNIIFGRLGHENYAAVTIIKTFQDVSFSLIAGLGTACCVIVGKSIGAGLIEKGYNDARRFSILVPLTSFISGLFVIAIRSPLIRLFDLSGNMTEYTLKTASSILIFVGLELAIRNVSYIDVVGIYRSGGDTLTGLKIDIIGLWVLSLPLTFVSAFVLDLPFVAVYAIMLLAEDVPKTILCTRHLISRKWIRPVTEEGKNALKKLEEI